jgi:hypothetical protein
VHTCAHAKGGKCRVLQHWRVHVARYMHKQLWPQHLTSDLGHHVCSFSTCVATEHRATAWRQTHSLSITMLQQHLSLCPDLAAAVGAPTQLHAKVTVQTDRPRCSPAVETQHAGTAVATPACSAAQHMSATCAEHVHPAMAPPSPSTAGNAQAQLQSLGCTFLGGLCC